MGTAIHPLTTEEKEVILLIHFGKSEAYGMSNDETSHYSDEDIIEFEAMFGEGFMSPGGQEEVAKIVENLSLAGKDVLDFGVGTGGPACLLVENHGAARITGIDVEDKVLKNAAQTVLRRGLQDRVFLKRVEPGPLPFDDESFDVVFSKDSIIHIHDKGACFGRSTASSGRAVVSL